MAALVIVDSALATRRVTVAELYARLGTKGSAAARIVLTLADADSESPVETIARVLLRVHGLDVQTQVYLDGVGRVDLLVEGVLVVELDGFEHHSYRAHYRNDRRRANALTCTGLRLVRFTYEDARPQAELDRGVRVRGARRSPNPCRFPRTDGTDVNC